MFTLVVTLAVVVLATAGALALAIYDPDQPATPRVRRERVKHRPPRRAPAPAAPARPRTSSPTRGPDYREPSPAGGLSDQWVRVAAGPSVWVRLRSGVVLTMLLAVVGALIAASVAGVVLFVAVAIRDAVS